MPPYTSEPEITGGRRQIAAAASFVLCALALLYMPSDTQERIAWTLRASVLRPFILTQERVVRARQRSRAVERLQAEMDSLTASLATQRAVVDENRTLRSLLELQERVGPAFRPASVLRPGTAGSESMFFVDVGEEDDVHEGAPVIDRHGLVGVIREARSEMSVGMDWTHPDFRASAMLADGSGFGVVENRRGEFRETDRMVLNGTAYYESVPSGQTVLTSGLGVFPRGIPIGTVAGVAEVEGRWRKSYWLRPMVEPGSVTHVLVAVGQPIADLSSAWLADSVVAADPGLFREQAHRDSLTALTDSVRALRARLEELMKGDTSSGGGR